MKRRMTELWLLATQDKKKLVVLCGLLGVLVFIGGRRAIEAGPSRAKAALPTTSDEVVAELERASAVTEDDLGPGGPIIEVPMLASGDRDLFRFNETYFPRPIDPNATGEVVPKSPGDQDETPSVDVRSVQEMLAERVRKESDSIRLTGTMVGSKPIAVLETGKGRSRTSEVLRPGDSMLGFVLIEVRSHSVVVEKEGVRVELRRQLPE